MLNIWQEISSSAAWYRSHVVNETDDIIVLGYMKSLVHLDKISGVINKVIVQTKAFNNLNSTVNINEQNNIVIDSPASFDRSSYIFNVREFFLFLTKLEEKINQIYEDHGYPLMYEESASKTQTREKQKAMREARKQELLENPNILRLKNLSKPFVRRRASEKLPEVYKQSNRITKSTAVRTLKIGRVVTIRTQNENEWS